MTAVDAPLTIFTPAPTAAAEYALAPDVLLVLVRDGTARLLDLGGRFYAIPAVGARMLCAALEAGPSAAAARIADEYGIDPDRARTDLAAWLGQLRRQGLILGRTDRRRRRGGWLSRLLLRTAFRLIRCLPSPTGRARRFLTLTRVCFALFGWAGTVALWQRCLPRPRAEGRVDPETAEATIRAVDEAVRAASARHVVRMACKERGMCGWAMLRCAGVPAELVVAIDLFPLAGHCWCEAGGLPLGDDPGRCSQFTPVVRYI
jgi:hypothetical protein